MRTMSTGFAAWISLCLFASVHALPAADEQPAPKPDAAESAEEQKQAQAAERFLVVLEKNPRRGTALDKVYGHSVETGKLDELVKRFADRTAANSRDGAAWMLLGLIESQRGRDAAAMTAFGEAEKVLPENALAPYYLGLSLVLVGQPDEAAAAFERAIARKPPRADLLDAFQALGRVYQRAQKGDQALEVWSRLEKLFPDDQRVQEQIATTLVEEGQHEQALPRFEALARKVKDDYRKSTYQIEAADIKVRLGKTTEALGDFEKLLSKLNPDNWLFRDVRRRIDDVYLRNDDQAGLATYYEGWISRNSEDVEAMARLARILDTLGRTPEAQQWLDKALKLAPTRKDLRQVLIDQLVSDRRYAAAIAQFELLAKNDPNNPDHLREWGRLILKDASRPEADRRRDAAAVWRRMIEARPKDSLTATQVADLFRHSEMTDEAIELYRKAIELSPDAAQYREYLGEYYHVLKQPAEALATWREIVAGKNHTAANLARLAEVLAGFGYVDEALVSIREACQLDKDEFKYPLQVAEMLTRAEKYAEALVQLDVAEKLVGSPEDSETVLQKRIRNLQLADQLTEVADGLRKELEAAKDATPERWYLLARYQEAARQLPDAARAIAKALELDEKAIPYLATAARISESAGSFQEAVDTFRKLAQIDRRFRTEHLTNVAKLEAQLGHVDQALQAGRDLLAAAPGNPENYEFYSQLCFQLGKVEDGLDALRRSVRLNPTDPKGMLTLAGALAEQFRTGEAIELYWRAFDKSNDLDAKLAVVPKLTELYLQTNQLDRLIERFERERREPDHQREMTICLAQTYQSSGDYGTARQELERLLTQNTRDTQLLQQLGGLAESEGDIQVAVKYQQQLIAVAPGKERDARLAQLLMRTGNTDEASEILARMTAEEEDAERILTSLDSLLGHEKYSIALSVTERLLREQAQNWELLYREGVALSHEKPDEASRRFRAILDLHFSDDEPGARAKARQQKNNAKPSNAVAARAVRQSNPLVERSQAVSQIRMATGLENRYQYASRQVRQFWGPSSFGQARMASLGWLLQFAQKQGKREEFLSALRQTCDKPNPDARDLWDWYYVQSLLMDQKSIYEATRRLSYSGDVDAQWLYLWSLSSRTQTGTQRVARSSADQADTTPPLPSEEMDHVLACLRSIQQKRPESIGEGSYYSQTLIANVTAELKRAGRTKDDEDIYRSFITGIRQPGALTTAIQLAATRSDTETVLELFDRLEREQLAQTRGAAASNSYRAIAASSLAQLLGSSSAADALRILDRYLAYAEHRKAAAVKGPRSSRRPTSSAVRAQGMYVQLWTGKTQRGVSLNYPAANEYFDQAGITLLRNAYERFKSDDVLSDLVAHFRSQADNAPEAQRLWWRLGLTYLTWWNEEQEQAVAEMTKAAALAPTDSPLQFQLAELQEKREDVEGALATAEAIVPVDHDTMQARETLVLRLAVRTGDAERARLAAERLFGLRLDAETQVQLVALMRQLGMHEHAEAVLARARRQAGNRMGALVSLMNQYQAEQKPDLAVQVAHQILRRAQPTGQGTSTRVSSVSDDAGARQSALQILTRSGKLKELIERAEAQLKASPESVQLHQALSEYYQASGNREKSLEIVQRLAKIRPEDAQLRYQIAQQLTQSGKPADAIPFYQAALKKEPGLFSQSYWEVQQAFQQANKIDELVALVSDLDMKSMGRYYTIANIVQTLMQNDKTMAAGLKLFRKAWEAYPDDRQNLFSYLHNDKIWTMPEIYDNAREAVIPREASQLSDPWGLIGQIRSYSGDGKVTGLVNPLIEAAAKQNKLPELKDEVEQALQKFPGWTGGKAFLALIHARQGKPEMTRQIIEGIVADNPKGIPPQACWILGQELDGSDATRPLARTLYESTLTQREVNINYEYSPTRRLVSIYQKTGDPEKARRLLLKLAGFGDDGQYDQNYAAYQRMQGVTSIGKQFVELGYPVDAVRVYNEVMHNSELQQRAGQVGGNIDYMQRELEKGYSQALGAVSKQSLAGMLSLLTPNEAPTRKESAGIVDLVLLVHPRELHKAELTSILAKAIHGGLDSKEQAPEILARIADLSGKYPDDYAVQVLSALAAWKNSQPEQIDAAAKRLEQLLAKKPLEELPAGVRANARQRSAAAEQIALWLVARECLKGTDRRPLGETLAARSLTAARRQLDSVSALAILREWGQIALDQGDRAAAESRWSEMLELVLPPKKVPAPASPKANPSKAAEAPATKPKPRRAAAASRVPASQALSATGAEPAARSVVAQLVAEQKPASPTPGGTRKSRAPAGAGGAPNRAALTPPATLSQFSQALEISRLAAENKMPQLSLRAVRDILQAGPPVKSQSAGEQFGASNQRVVRRSRQTDDDETTVHRQVGEKLLGVVEDWNKAAIPAADQYEALLIAVFPETRPGEIFLYPLALTAANLRRPRSVGRVLVTQAVKASRQAELQQKTGSRKDLPMAKLPAQVLLTWLAIDGQQPDQAREALKGLEQQLQSDTLQHSAELACHAALPVLDREDVADAAAPIVAVAVQRLGDKSAVNQVTDEPLQSLLLRLARVQFRRRDFEGGRKQLKLVLDFGQRNNVRYAGDYGSNRRKLQCQQVALEFAKAGLLNDALEYLGQFADIPYGRYVESPIGGTLGQIAHMTDRLPAAERYELLKNWTLPTGSRQAVRLVGGTVAPDEAPDSLKPLALWNRDAPQGGDKAPSAEGSTTANANLGGSSSPYLLTTADLLVSAARQAGRLDDLASALQPAADKDLENAKTLKLLVSLAQGNGAASKSDLQARAADYAERMAKENQVRQFPWADYALARASADHAPIREVGITYLGHILRVAQRFGDRNSIIHLQNELAMALTLAASGGEVQPVRNPGLSLWRPSGQSTAAQSATGEVQGWWVAQEDQISRIVGPAQDYLYFDYPLAGEFEFALDVYCARRAEGEIGYAGLDFDLLSTDGPPRIRPVGRHETLTRPEPSLKKMSDFNRLVLEVRRDRIRCFVNGHLAYELANPSPTSPWLTLGSAHSAQTVFRNLSLTGNVRIPREVPLTDADRLDGWISAFFQTSQPPVLTIGQKKSPPNANEVVVRDTNPDAYFWTAQDGVISSRSIDEQMRLEPKESRLYYHRPLADGDAVRYDFFYEPDKFAVHPTLGRLAFLLDPAGVRLHWICDTADVDTWTGLAVDNSAEELQFRSGPLPLPLKAGDWNAARIALDGGVMSLQLNGVEILRRPLEATNERQFGFFHDSSLTAVRVRNVVLSGKWPETLSPETLRNLTAKKAGTLDGADRLATHAIFKESFLALNGARIQDQARALAPPERYRLLREWVLPTADHPTIRVNGDFTPTDPPAPASVTLPSDASAPTPLARGETGGTLTAPVLDLLNVARELNKLEELRKLAEDFQTSDPVQKRNRLAFLSLVALARKEPETVKKHMAEIRPLLAEVAPEAPESERWSELILASESLSVPELRAPALELLEAMVSQNQQKESTLQWKRRLRALRDHARYLLLPPSEQGTVASKQWTPVTHGNAESHGTGVPHPLWTFTPGATRHYAGHDHDYLYFQSPLRGNFEVSCRLDAPGSEQLSISYGGTWVRLLEGGSRYETSHYGRGESQLPTDPSTTKSEDGSEFRLSVQDGKYVVTIDGRKIHEQNLPPDPDPWLAIHALGHTSGSVRNLRITGTPTVCETISLSDSMDLGEWLPSYYAESIGSDTSRWYKEGEIIGRLDRDVANSHRQSVLRYHRPLLEDGELEYEFFYEPNAKLVHPALDRLAFLLDPDGVRTHWLTDAQFDRTGIAHDNSSEEPDRRRGPKTLPLKERDWNRLKLSLAGNVVSLRLNDVEIYERPLEATNQRTFGLFHYSDQTEVRVRNVKYTGNWPRAVPPVEKQELAAPGGK